MTENIFQTIADKKNNLKKFAQKALDFNWINKEEFKAINSKLENDVLTIGVIGQMKCGKSTLLNALVFGEEILPAATTPMTASLSIITYGEEKRIEVEFYSSNEWEELKHLAKREFNETELDDNIKSKIKAAKEILEKSYSIGSEIERLLNTKQEADFNYLIDYVGADGKYISITKAVKIFMPLDYLKGVEIVDTPGFNDPIVSREERTKAFLAKADAVIMLLYAGRAFDAVDKDIIFNQLRTIGIGKLMIGVNKYDLCIEDESEAEIIDNVKNNLKLASKEHNNSIAKLVMEKAPLLLSANMALMAKMDFESINKDDKNWGFYYKQASDIFGISNQKEMLEKSLFPEFEKALMQIIFESKDEILIQKPINLIKQKGENKLTDLISNHSQVRNRLSILKKHDCELDELLKNTRRSERKIKKKVEILEGDIADVLEKGITHLNSKTQNLIFDCKVNCYHVIENHGVILKKDNLVHNLKLKIAELEMDLKELFERTNTELNSKLNKETERFLSEVEEIIEKYDEDFDIQDYMKLCRNVLTGKILNLNFKDLIPSTNGESTEKSLWEKALDLYSGLVDGLTLGILSGTVNKTINLIFGKEDTREWIDYFFSQLDISIIEKEIKSNGYEIVDEVKKKFLKDFLSPIINQLDEINLEERNKDAEILDKEDNLKELDSEKKKLENELMEMEFIM